MVGMELQKPNKGGSSVTVFKRGEAPKAGEDSTEKPRLQAHVEFGVQGVPSPRLKEADSQEQTHDIAKSTSTFTFDNVNYTIPTQNRPRKLLQDVTGYVEPGRLAALMGPSGAG